MQGEAQFEGDRDWFAVSLEAGETYVAWLRGRDGRGGTSWDPHVYGVTDGAGVAVEATIGGDGGLGTDATALFTVSAAGTYFVSAGAAAGERGTYTLSVERWVGVGEGSGEDFAARASTRGRLVGAKTVWSRLDPSDDRDWFAAHLTAGHRYRIFSEAPDTWRAFSAGDRRHSRLGRSVDPGHWHRG